MNWLSCSAGRDSAGSAAATGNCVKPPLRCGGRDCNVETKFQLLDRFEIYFSVLYISGLKIAVFYSEKCELIAFNDLTRHDVRVDRTRTHTAQLLVV